MGYRIGYNGPQVDNLLQKGYNYSVINNGWTKLASSDLAATNLDTLVTPGNYSTSFWQNGPIQLVTNGPINVCVTKDSSSNTLYQTIYDAGKIYIRSTTSTSFSNTWREEKNDNSLDIGASTPINPSDNYIWIDTSADVPVIKIYKETKDEWVAISAANLAKKSVYDKNNIGKPFTTYLDEKIAEGDLVTAENTYKKHIVEGEDTGNPIHVTSEEKLKWNAGINSSEADTLINNFKKDMQSYADEKVNTSSTKINDLTTEINDQKKIMDNHMGDNTIHLTADQVTAFDNKAAGNHTHLNDGTVTVSATNLTGLIPIERLDPSVLERNYTVSSYDDLFNLTKNEVQNGDSVYVNETHPSAWFVVDDSKLGTVKDTALTPGGLVQYAAPTPELTWNNITNKPTTISDYGLSNTYYTEDEINALYKKYKDQYDAINKSVSDITDSLLEIPEDLSTTYDTNLARASELNKKLDDLLHSLGLNDKMISDMVNMYKERSIIYKSSLDTEIDFDSLTIGSTFFLGKYQVESETPWDIEWEIVHQTSDYQIAMTKQIIDLRPFDGKEPNNTNNGRKSWGNNNWQYSNIEQWMNSDQASWYSAQHQYDAPPTSSNCWKYSNGTTYNAYDTHKGFLYYFSDEEKTLLQDMTFTLLNHVVDGGGSYTWTGKVWLPTYTQMGGGQNNSISEGEAFSKFTDDSSRIKSLHPNCAANNEYCKLNNYASGRNCWYWMSSANPSYSRSVRFVGNDGSVGAGNVACYGHIGFAPCICIPRHGKFVNKHDFTKEITVKYVYLNPSTDNLPTAAISNKPADSTYSVDYTTPNYTHTIDDDHYPEGYTMSSDDGTGYWVFSGWEIDTTGQKTVTVSYQYIINGDSSLLPNEITTNKPVDVSYEVDYYDESKSNYTHTIDDEHYPEGYTINSTDNSGYWEFSGWKES